jgi:hypothetical protein
MARASFSEDDRKYLDQLQAVIARMGANSFALKGWSVTLVSAILALSNKDPRVVMLAFIPVLIFWGLDAYYLALERGFSKLVTSFVNGSADAPVYGFKTGSINWLEAVYRPAMLFFYGALIGLTAILYALWRAVPSSP